MNDWLILMACVLAYPFSWLMSNLLVWPYWWAYNVLIEEGII